MRDFRIPNTAAQVAPMVTWNATRGGKAKGGVIWGFAIAIEVAAGTLGASAETVGYRK